MKKNRFRFMQFLLLIVVGFLSPNVALADYVDEENHVTYVYTEDGLFGDEPYMTAEITSDAQGVVEIKSSVVDDEDGESYPVWFVGACGDATNMTSVTIPNGVKIIGESAFENLKNLQGISIPKTVTEIRESAFKGCTSLTLLSMRSSQMIRIGESAFEGCSNLAKTLTLPNTIEFVGDNAFNGCAFTSLTLAKGGTANVTIGKYAFKNCPFKITTTFAIPDNYISIGDGAFQNCASMSGKLTLGSGLNSIGASAFEGASFSGSLTIPSSLTSLGDYSFKGCKFSDIVGLETLTSIGKGVFQDNVGFKGVLDISSLQKIGPYAFAGCTGITDITFATSALEIGERAFSGCTGLTNVKLPAATSLIGKLPFENCTNLIGLYFSKTTRPNTSSTSDQLVNVPTCFLYVPEDLSDKDDVKNNYMHGTSWVVGNGGFKYYHPNLVNRSGVANLSDNIMRGFTTAYVNFNFDVPKNITAYYAYDDDGVNIKLKKVPANANGKVVIPAQKAVILIDETNTLGNGALYDICETNETSTSNYTTSLSGSLIDMPTPEGAYTLGVGNGIVGFYSYTGSTVAAHKVYYIPTKTSALSSRLFCFDNLTTGVNAITNTQTKTSYYELNGKAAINPMNGGLYIHNGKLIKY